MKINEARLKLNNILLGLDRFIESLEDVEYDYENLDELFERDQLRTIGSKLDSALSTLKHLNSKILIEGYAWKNENGRYEINGIEMSSGYPVDALVQGLETTKQYFIGGGHRDIREEVSEPYWISTRIEHNGTDYYIYGIEDSKRNLRPVSDYKIRIRK